MTPSLRRATIDDAPAIAVLMRRSVLEIFPAHYDQAQVAAAAIHIAVLDPSLIEDGTYYVHEHRGEIVACGGWSRRHRLHAGAAPDPDDGRPLDPATEPARVRAMFVRADHTRRGLGRAILEACERDACAEGFTKLSLMATLPGEPLYRAFGFTETGREWIPTPGCDPMEAVRMQRPISGTIRS